MPQAFFARGDAIWHAQNNDSSTGSIPDDDFWHFNAVAGYRFPQRRAEIAVGLLNITDQDYRLNPLNSVIELPSRSNVRGESEVQSISRLISSRSGGRVQSQTIHRLSSRP
jgi:hypothetical protein